MLPQSIKYNLTHSGKKSWQITGWTKNTGQDNIRELWCYLSDYSHCHGDRKGNEFWRNSNLGYSNIPAYTSEWIIWMPLCPIKSLKILPPSKSLNSFKLYQDSKMSRATKMGAGGVWVEPSSACRHLLSVKSHQIFLCYSFFLGLVSCL